MINEWQTTQTRPFTWKTIIMRENALLNNIKGVSANTQL